jgi:SAM-dependent methyltransferase
MNPDGEALAEWLPNRLVCPSDRLPLALTGGHLDGTLRCSRGHTFSIVQGIPVLLLDAPDATHPYCAQSLDFVRAPAKDPRSAPSDDSGAIDEFVQGEIVKTNGNLYRHLLGRLPRYPIPNLRLPAGDGKLMLDVGCNWGRWTMSAARAGYRAVGIDPGLDAALAGQRVARQLGLKVAFVVGDARRLPFADGTFDVGFSYSVFQHFDKENARQAFRELSRVISLDGTILVQMANLLGLRQAFNRVQQVVKGDANEFRVRYWLAAELRRTFETLVGPSRIEVDGFFSLNPQPTDMDLMTPFRRWVVRASETLRKVSHVVPPLTSVADSLYVQSTNRRRYQDDGQARASTPR